MIKGQEGKLEGVELDKVFLTMRKFQLKFAKVGIVATAGIPTFVVLTAAMLGCIEGMIDHVTGNTKEKT